MTVSFGRPAATADTADDDGESVTYTAAEGGTATVTVTLSADPERTVHDQPGRRQRRRLPVTTTNQGGATAPPTTRGVPLSHPRHQIRRRADTSKTFDFAATADTEDDDGESVKLAFGSRLPTGVSAGALPDR